MTLTFAPLYGVYRAELGGVVAYGVTAERAAIALVLAVIGHVPRGIGRR